jgi:multidrug resistance efflux pump
MASENSSLTPTPTSTHRRAAWWLAVIPGLALVGALLWYFASGTKHAAPGLTFVARRGPLDITVLEGGSVQAAESQEVKCEVRVGYQGTKILKIVEEGYQVTDDDIRTNKVLVELDSSDLQKQLAQQEIQHSQAVASLTDAQQAHEIQLNQNLSDIKAAEQKARFARMDFDKFLGDYVAGTVIAELGLERVLASEQTNLAAVRTNAPALAASAVTVAVPAPGTTNRAANASATEPLAHTASGATATQSTNGLSPSSAALPSITGAPNTNAADVPAPPSLTSATNRFTIDFAKFARIELLGDGEAKQKIRELQDTLQVAQKEESQAQVNLAGTKRLFDKGFVTKTDLQQNEIAADNARLKVQKAETARDLYLKYEFIKTAEDWLSKYAEAVRELNRARKAAISKLAQTEARWRSAQAQFQVQSRQLNEVKEQLAKCTIAARKPGLVVYGGGGEDMWYGGEERIREGATVRERQSIITIPNMSKMVVKVKIPEAYIKRIKKGQKVRITVDAFPDTTLNGEVTKVGVLPDSQNRWMNPDLKVYLTTITIDGTYDWIKPGMSAKVEIIVDRLPDAVYLPIQAVVPQDGRQFCYLASGKNPDRREVEIGQYNDTFIEIKQGLKEGEIVLLRRPEAAAPAGTATNQPPAGPATEKPRPQPAAAPAPATASPAPKSQA